MSSFILDYSQEKMITKFFKILKNSKILDIPIIYQRAKITKNYRHIAIKNPKLTDTDNSVFIKTL